jgi:hypothetical protein
MNGEELEDGGEAPPEAQIFLRNAHAELFFE